MSERPRIKICCIKSRAEADLAIQYGADAIGLVASMPSGPGVIEETLIRQIAEGIPPPVGSFLLTSSQDTGEIIRQQRFCRTDTIQLCDRLPHESYTALRSALPGVKLVQVLHVAGTEVIREARLIESHVDAILLDSGDPLAPVKVLGGTGRMHDWEISRALCRSITCPVFLAGGINADNVKEALSFVRPFGIDICSGVRTGDRLDEKKLDAFFNRIYL
jgi:phosphoribosylanthranilate isomerase